MPGAGSVPETSEILPGRFADFFGSLKSAVEHGRNRLAVGVQPHAKL